MGPWPVQIRLHTGATDKEYVATRGWESATLSECPLHGRGRCGLHRNGTYPRVKPQGCRVARYYCPEGHCTFSLLPDCLASRLSSSLDAIEEVALAVELAPSLEAAASALRPDIELPGAIRWTRRRVDSVRRLMLTIVTLFALPSAPSLAALRVHFERPTVLMFLRDEASGQLPVLPPYVGFGPRTHPKRARDGPSNTKRGQTRSAHRPSRASRSAAFGWHDQGR